MNSALALIALAVLASGCDFAGLTKAADEEQPVTLFGVGDAPDEPPASCKFVTKVDVTSSDNEIPERKLKNAARKNDANAITSIRKGGSSEGYLGKEYSWRATLLWCPRPKAKPATSASAAASAQ